MFPPYDAWRHAEQSASRAERLLFDNSMDLGVGPGGAAERGFLLAEAQRLRHVASRALAAFLLQVDAEVRRVGHDRGAIDLALRCARLSHRPYTDLDHWPTCPTPPS